MRILQISHNYHIVGGSDAVFFATTALLENAGHEVIPFCIDNPNNCPSHWAHYFPKAADTQSAPFHDAFRYFFNSDAVAKLKDLLDSVGKIDVAHLHIYHGKQTPSILPTLRQHGIPIVHTLHEYKLACPVYTMQRNGDPCDLCVSGSDFNSIRHRCKDNSVMRTLIMTAEKSVSRLLGDVRLVDRFICVSEFLRRIMIQAGLPAGRLHTLHNFAKPADTPRLGHDGYFLYFGRIEEIKGIQTMVDAFKRCGRRLLIAGGGGWQSELKKSIQHSPNVTYLGFKSGRDLDQLIGRAQAVVVPSQWYENCPMTILEAKAAGRPVIGADIGGIPELVRHGTDGFLFKPKDVGALIAALKSVENSCYSSLSNNAWQDARERFSADAHLTALLTHYSDMIERATMPAVQPG